MTITINIPTPKINPVTAVKNYRYERMIRKSQAKLAETKLVPGYTQIWA